MDSGSLRPASLFLLAISLLVIDVGQAEVYRWTGEDGRIHFGDRPPAEAEPEQLELHINTNDAPQIVNRPSTTKSRSKISDRKVVMYSAGWCGVCKHARAYFKAKRIPYAEYDIETSSKGRRDFRRLGGKGVPIILVGEGRMNGFSVVGFRTLYGQ